MLQGHVMCRGCLAEACRVDVFNTTRKPQCPMCPPGAGQLVHSEILTAICDMDTAAATTFREKWLEQDLRQSLAGGCDRCGCCSAVYVVADMLPGARCYYCGVDPTVQLRPTPQVRYRSTTSHNPSVASSSFHSSTILFWAELYMSTASQPRLWRVGCNGGRANASRRVADAGVHPGVGVEALPECGLRSPCRAQRWVQPHGVLVRHTLLLRLQQCPGSSEAAHPLCRLHVPGV